MYLRFVVNKINHRTNCFQGVLVTLGTLQHNGQLSSKDEKEAKAIFEILNDLFPTPPEIETQEYRDVISWFNSNVPNNNHLIDTMKRVARLLQNREYEILVLRANEIKNAIYSDDFQTLVKAGTTDFTKEPFQ